MCSGSIPRTGSALTRPPCVYLRVVCDHPGDSERVTYCPLEFVGVWGAGVRWSVLVRFQRFGPGEYELGAYRHRAL